MYESYSRQALPQRRYRELIGSAICVFNANNSFIIENILHNDKDAKYSWHDLINRVSGKLSDPIRQTISVSSNDEIASMFEKIIEKRNRIIHSFQITLEDEQILATKDHNNCQFVITEDFLLEFIQDNEKLSMLLYDFRGF